MSNILPLVITLDSMLLVKPYSPMLNGSDASFTSHRMQKSFRQNEIKKSIAKDFGKVCDAENLEQANNAQKDIFDQYSEIAPALGIRLQNNAPEALTVFLLPKNH